MQRPPCCNGCSTATASTAASTLPTSQAGRPALPGPLARHRPAARWFGCRCRARQRTRLPLAWPWQARCGPSRTELTRRTCRTRAASCRARPPCRCARAERSLPGYGGGRQRGRVVRCRLTSRPAAASRVPAKCGQLRPLHCIPAKRRRRQAGEAAGGAGGCGRCPPTPLRAPPAPPTEEQHVVHDLLVAGGLHAHQLEGAVGQGHGRAQVGVGLIDGVLWEHHGDAHSIVIWAGGLGGRRPRGGDCQLKPKGRKQQGETQRSHGDRGRVR